MTNIIKYRLNDELDTLFLEYQELDNKYCNLKREGFNEKSEEITLIKNEDKNKILYWMKKVLN